MVLPARRGAHLPPQHPSLAVTAAAAQLGLSLGLHTQSHQLGHPRHPQGLWTRPVQGHSPQTEAMEMAWHSRPDLGSLKREKQHQTKPLVMPVA